MTFNNDVELQNHVQQRHSAIQTGYVEIEIDEQPIRLMEQIPEEMLL